MSPEKKSTPSGEPILLCYPSAGPSEFEFWRRLREELRARRHELYILGPEEDLRLYRAAGDDVPFVVAPRGFDGLFTRHGGYGQKRREVEWLDRLPLDVDEIVRREKLWTGRGGSQRTRRVAVHVSAAAHAAALALLRPRLVVMWNGEQTQELILRELISWCHGSVCFAERSPLPGWLYLDPQGLMARAQFAGAEIRWEEEAQHKAWRGTVQAYRDLLVSKGSTWYPQADVASPEELRKQLAIPSGHKVVVFAGQLDVDTQNFWFSPHFEGNLDAFKSFCALARKAGNVYVLGKHHPLSAAPAARYRRVVEGIGTWREDVSLSTCLHLADGVAAVNSSVLFEAAMLGKPCLALGQTLVTGRDVFFEMEGAEDFRTFQAWLAFDKSAERQERWQEVCAWLLAHHFYYVENEPFHAEVAQRGPGALADRLVRLAAASAPDYSPLVPSAFRSLSVFHAYNSFRRSQSLRARLGRLRDAWLKRER